MAWLRAYQERFTCWKCLDLWICCFTCFKTLPSCFCTSSGNIKCSWVQLLIPLNGGGFSLCQLWTTSDTLTSRGVMRHGFGEQHAEKLLHHPMLHLCRGECCFWTPIEGCSHQAVLDLKREHGQDIVIAACSSETVYVSMFMLRISLPISVDYTNVPCLHFYKFRDDSWTCESVIHFCSVICEQISLVCIWFKNK